METYVKDLFKYLDVYENKYSEFDTEAFLQTYNGIYAVFQALREQRNKAVEIDRFMLEKIKLAPLTGSDLRQLSIQILITFFESEADTDGKSNQAFSYCRGLRAVKQDVPFFENHLVPLLFLPGALNNNSQLNAFFLNEIGRYINKFGKSINAALTPEEFDSMSMPMKFLELGRRRLVLGNDLLRDHGSLEFHLQRINAYEKLAKNNKLNEYYLSEWQYLTRTSFWAKVAGFFREAGAKIKGVFSNWRYFRLVISQRNPAYLFYGLIIVIFILLAVLVPRTWNDYADDKLGELEKRSTIIRQTSGR